MTISDENVIEGEPGTPNVVRRFLRLVMIEHSVFALPFAYIAALTAMWRQTRTVHWVELLLITCSIECKLALQRACADPQLTRERFNARPLAAHAPCENGIDVI